MRRLALAACCALLAPHSARAQRPPVDAAPEDSLALQAPSRALRGIGTGLLVNVVVNRFDRWVLREDFARVTPASWWRNLRLGWEWDENQFGTNMFAHPYHGSLYFNGGRHNGLSYWESIPLAFIGSWTWEHLGERHRPSLNDFVMTSFGGIALGEIFGRIGAGIRQAAPGTPAPLWRELVALPFDPIGSLDRLTGGRGRRTHRTMMAHPDAFMLRTYTGMRITGDREVSDSSARSLTALIDFLYGDPLDTPYTAPFDVFAIRGQVSSGGGLHQLRATGRLYGRNITRQTARHRHQLTVNQRFEYIDNPAQRYGGQSVEVGFNSRWRLSNTLGVRTQAFGNAILLGAIDAPDAGVGERDYDFGPGLGVRLEGVLELRGLPVVAAYAQTEYVRSVSGATADHLAHFGGFEFTVPVARDFGIGIHTGYFNRLSRYSDRPDQRREYPEVRLISTWTLGNTVRNAP